MTTERYHKNLTVPTGTVDLIVDTDAYNGIDDQFAVSYVLSLPEKFNLFGITAAPFYNETVKSLANGMEESYYEVMKLLTLTRNEALADRVIMGAKSYLPSASASAESEAADLIISQAKKHTADHPLYILALGPPTNIASAFLKEPGITGSCVVVWCNGDHPAGFNVKQDPFAASVLSSCGVPLVRIPAANSFHVTKAELETHLVGRNPIAHYLASNALTGQQPGAFGSVSAFAWLLGIIDRDAIAADLFSRLGNRNIKMDLTGYKLVFEDDFDQGILDPEKWEHRRCGPSRCGYKATNNARVENGNLILSYGYCEDGDFGPGWYGADLHITKRYTRGYFECRCICNDPYPSNFWSAFWLQARGPYTPHISRGGPGSAEVDVMEATRVHQPNDPEDVRSGAPGMESNIHVTGMKHAPYTFPGHNTQHPFPIRAHIPDAYTAYHTYALEWTREVYRFFVDGICILETDWGDGVSEVDLEVCVSICDPLTAPKDKSLTGEMLIDYIRIWQKDEDIGQ